MGAEAVSTDRHFMRQLATIISIDAADFSRLMAIDDEYTIGALEHRREVIRNSCASFGGRLFGVAGDSIMAEFGEPVEALLAVLDFQTRIAELNGGVEDGLRMAFRAGINTGHVIVRESSRYGDDVNIAARLQEIASAGGVVVSETTWNHVRGKAAAKFVDLGEQSFHNITIPVRAYRVERAVDIETTRTPPAPAAPALGQVGNGFVATSPVPARGGVFRADGKGGPPRVAVLPFRYEGGEQETRYLAEAVAEDIIHGLSNTRWLPVIAMASSSQFRDDAMGPVAAGQELDARYVVSGVLARAGEQIRVRVMLDDASTSRRLWTGRFDRPFAGMLAMQDEIGNEIVGILEKEVENVEQARTFRVPWESLETWQLVRRGRWHMARRTREDTEQAYEFFRSAYQRDPNSSAVLDELAWWHFWRGWLKFGGSGAHVADLEKVVEYSRKALYMDRQDARPHAYLGIVDIMSGRPRQALDHLREALSLNPSFAFARSALGSGHLLLGEPKKAIPLLLDAGRLSPFDHYRFHNLGELAAAYAVDGEPEEALAAAERSLSLSPAYWYARFLKVSSLVRLGRKAEASEERALLTARDPDFTTRRVEWIPFADKAIYARLIAPYEEVA